jgi:flavin-dependent dehydrogenase
MESYDLLIVGAGLAGLQCARLLGKKGWRVLLVDKKASLHEKVHTTGIFVRRTLEDFDLPAQYLGPVINHVTLYSPQRRSITLSSPHNEFRVGRMAGLYQHYLDDCLRVGVNWLPDTRYIGSSLLKSYSVVSLETGGKRVDVKARFIVGADGARSIVARDLSLDTNREFIVGVEEVFGDVPRCEVPMFHCFLDPIIAPGYLAWLVHDGEEIHLGVGGYRSSFNPVKALQDFKVSVKNIVDLTGTRYRERRGGAIPVGGILKNIANHRGLLLGDAAGAVSPLTAGGLDPCMRLSEMAANIINEYLITEDASLIRRYSGDLFKPRFATRLIMRRAFSMIHSPLLIELGTSLLRLPVFNRLAWHIFFGRGSFPDVEVGVTEPIYKAMNSL